MLISLRDILQLATDKGVAIPAINTPSFESIDAAIAAAESLNLPIIIEHCEAHYKYAPLDIIAPVMVDAARRAKVPVCAHLDHSSTFGQIERGIALGFSSVMFDGSRLSFEENVEKTKLMADQAHASGVSIEAELGSIYTTVEQGSLYTDPILAEKFVERTGIDALAVAFGTAHGIYSGVPVLDFDVLQAIKNRVDIPLVMHGGSGVSNQDFKRAIAIGVRKINYYSYMAAEAYQAVRAYTLAHNEPGNLFHELSWLARNSMKDHIVKVLKTFSLPSEKSYCP